MTCARWVPQPWAVTLLLLFVANSVWAQVPDPDYVLRVSDAVAPQAELIELSVELDNFGAPIQGWTFGVCHDPTRLELLTATDSPLSQTVQNGGPPDFNALAILPDGWTKAVLICFTGCATLTPGPNHTLNFASYRVTGYGPDVTSVNLCPTLGTPVVPLVVTVAGQSVPPTVVSGTVDILVGTPPVLFHLIAGDVTSLYDPASGVTTAAVPVLLLEDAISATPAHGISAFSFSLAHVPDHISAYDVTLGSDLIPDDPDFFSPLIHDFGITLEVDLGSAGFFYAPSPQEVAVVHYQSLAPTLAFNPFGVEVPLTWDPDIASPAIPHDIDAQGPWIQVVTTAGVLRLVPRESLLRGDANDSGAVDIADVTTVLDAVFGGSTVLCRDAADGNDDGALDIADAVSLLSYLFSGGAPLPPPSVQCGWDETGLPNCLVYNSCP